MAITRHEKNGRVLRATWAKVRKEERGGVERYLAETIDRSKVTAGPATAPFPSTFLGESKRRPVDPVVCSLCWEGCRASTRQFLADEVFCYPSHPGSCLRGHAEGLSRTRVRSGPRRAQPMPEVTGRVMTTRAP